MQEALEENRQHLVRALRAVELTTAETREEASQAVERVVELEGALDVQAHTVRDLREQVYALQLRAQRSADERATHQQGQDLALLAGRLARLEEAAPPVEERVAGCETRAGEMQVGLENLGSWVQSTLQQRAVESERQMSIMHIAMQTYVQQQIESSLSERLDTDIADLKQSVVHLTEDNASLREQVSHQIESASERLYQQMEVSSERLAPEIADLKESVAHLQEENANLREQVANSQAAIPSDLPSPGTTSRIEEALSSPRVEREDKEAPRPKSPATPREASKDLVAQESAARDQRLAATIDQVAGLAGDVAELEGALHREANQTRATLDNLSATLLAHAAQHRATAESLVQLATPPAPPATPVGAPPAPDLAGEAVAVEQGAGGGGDGGEANGAGDEVAKDEEAAGWATSLRDATLHVGQEDSGKAREEQAEKAREEQAANAGEEQAEKAGDADARVGALEKPAAIAALEDTATVGASSEVVQAAGPQNSGSVGGATECERAGSGGPDVVQVGGSGSVAATDAAVDTAPERAIHAAQDTRIAALEDKLQDLAKSVAGVVSGAAQAGGEASRAVEERVAAAEVLWRSEMLALQESVAACELATLAKGGGGEELDTGGQMEAVGASGDAGATLLARLTSGEEAGATLLARVTSGEDMVTLLAQQLDHQKTAQESLAEEVREQARSRRPNEAAFQTPARSEAARSVLATPAGPDAWAVEGRVARLELALIEVLEQQGDKGGGEAEEGLSQRLGDAEESSQHLVAGIQRLSHTIQHLIANQATLEAKLLEAVQSSSSAVASLSLQSAPLAVGVTPPALGRSPSQDPPSLTPPETASGGVVASAQQRWAGAPMPTLQEELLKLGTEQQRLRAEQQRLQAELKRTAFLVTEALQGDAKAALPDRSLVADKADRKDLVDKVDRKELAAYVEKASLAGLAERPALELVEASQRALAEALQDLKSTLQTVKGEVQTLASEGGQRDAKGARGGKAVAAMVGAFDSGVAPLGEKDDGKASRPQPPAALDRATQERLSGLERAVQTLEESGREMQRSMASTLEVASEAFGDATPFLMKDTLDPLEANLNELALRLEALEAREASAAPPAKAVLEIDVARLKGELSSSMEMARGESKEALAALGKQLADVAALVAAKVDRSEVDAGLAQVKPGVASAAAAATAPAGLDQTDLAKLRAEFHSVAASIEETRAAAAAAVDALRGEVASDKSHADVLQNATQAAIKDAQDKISVVQGKQAEALEEHGSRLSGELPSAAEMARGESKEALAALGVQLAELTERVSTKADLEDLAAKADRSEVDAGLEQVRSTVASTAAGVPQGGLDKKEDLAKLRSDLAASIEETRGAAAAAVDALRGEVASDKSNADVLQTALEARLSGELSSAAETARGESKEALAAFGVQLAELTELVAAKADLEDLAGKADRSEVDASLEQVREQVGAGVAASTAASQDRVDEKDLVKLRVDVAASIEETRGAAAGAVDALRGEVASGMSNSGMLQNAMEAAIKDAQDKIGEMQGKHQEALEQHPVRLSSELSSAVETARGESQEALAALGVQMAELTERVSTKADLEDLAAKADRSEVDAGLEQVRSTVASTAAGVSQGLDEKEDLAKLRVDLAASIEEARGAASGAVDALRGEVASDKSNADVLQTALEVRLSGELSSAAEMARGESKEALAALGTQLAEVAAQLASKADLHDLAAKADRSEVDAGLEQMRATVAATAAGVSQVGLDEKEDLAKLHSDLAASIEDTRGAAAAAVDALRGEVASDKSNSGVLQNAMEAAIKDAQDKIGDMQGRQQEGQEKHEALSVNFKEVWAEALPKIKETVDQAVASKAERADFEELRSGLERQGEELDRQGEELGRQREDRAAARLELAGGVELLAGEVRAGVGQAAANLEELREKHAALEESVAGKADRPELEADRQVLDAHRERGEEVAAALEKLQGEVRASVAALRDEAVGQRVAASGDDAGQVSEGARVEMAAALGRKAERVEVEAQQEALAKHREDLAGALARVAALEESARDEALGLSVAALDAAVTQALEDAGEVGDRVSLLEESVDGVRDMVDALDGVGGDVATLRMQVGELDGAVERVETNGALREARLSAIEASLDKTRADLDQEMRSARIGGSRAGSVRSERSERALQDLEAEMSAATAGSARIRALRDRVRGVTSPAALPPRPPPSPAVADAGAARSGRDKSVMSVAKSGSETGVDGASPVRSVLEVTAEAIRGWEDQEQDRRSRASSPAPDDDFADLSQGTEGTGELEFV